MIDKNEDVAKFRERLERTYAMGVELYLNGYPSTPARIVECCVEENAIYMPDFVTDEDGKLIQVRYDRVEDDPFLVLTRQRDYR